MVVVLVSAVVALQGLPSPQGIGVGPAAYL